MDTFECPECNLKFETENNTLNHYYNCHLKIRLFSDDDGTNIETLKLLAQERVTQAESSQVFKIPKIQPKLGNKKNRQMRSH